MSLSRIPTPVAPPTTAITDVIGDAIAIAIVCFVVNISMAKLFASKYKYTISANQVTSDYVYSMCIESI
jgi:MFS superfamily sulfate permease-like transporter